MWFLRPHRSPPRRLKRDSGFSLVEALVALVLVDVALLAIVHTHAVVVRRRNEMRARSAAIAAATTRVEQLLASPCTAASGVVSTRLLSEIWSQRIDPHVREVADSVVFGAPSHDVVLRTRLPC